MDLAERIARRRVNSTAEDLVADWEKLDPSVHLDEPVGRGSVLERILDAMEPLFRGEVPSNLAVWGPQGTGKSAIVVSLLSTLTDEFTESRSRLYTATRGGETRDRVRFAYADARRTSSEHKLYYSILEHLTPESVPERGIGTETLRDRIATELAGSPGAVVAIDHVGESEAIDQASLSTMATEFENAAWITIGRSSPESLSPGEMAAQVEVPAYRTHELIDLLTVRANRGLTAGVSHAQARRIAEWADGDAHDALVALFTAAMAARESGNAQVRDADVDVAIDRASPDAVPVGRVLALSENRQTVLETLFEIPEGRRETIETTADAIAANSSLTQTTVRRFLYELADDGFLEKVRTDATPPGGGRRATRLEPRFPVAVFRQLRSLER